MTKQEQKKLNKYTYLYVLQANYGYGWDDLTSSENYIETLADLKSYRDNDPRPYRIIHRRVTNA